jgi:dCMP deaminase
MGLSSPIRITRENMFKQIVEITAQRSSCVRKQVGAILVKDNRIISQGYNGPAAGINCPVCEGPGCSKAIHAEINAIVFAARAGVSIEGSDLYITLSPCVNCAKAIINSGIKNVYFIEKYRDTAGIDLLISAHINCQELIE